MFDFTNISTKISLSQNKSLNKQRNGILKVFLPSLLYLLNKLLPVNLKNKYNDLNT